MEAWLWSETVPPIFFVTLFQYKVYFPQYVVANKSVIWSEIAEAPECA